MRLLQKVPATSQQALPALFPRLKPSRACWAAAGQIPSLSVRTPPGSLLHCMYSQQLIFFDISDFFRNRAKRPFVDEHKLQVPEVRHFYVDAQFQGLAGEVLHQLVKFQLVVLAVY